MRYRKNPFMNYLKNLTYLLLLSALSFSAEAQTENQPEYYRYFTVNVQDLTSSEFDQFTAKRANSQTYEFNAFCNSSSLVLVRCDASIPKRIEDMKADVREILKNQFSSARIESISSISYSDQLNFCK